MKTRNILAKVCLLGDGEVGKTSLIRKFVLDQFRDEYIATVGTKVSKKNLELTFPKYDTKLNMTLTIWDILGQRDFSNLHTSFYSGGSGALLVCDLTRKDTLESLNQWIENLFETTGEIPIIILGNKCDLKDDHQVTKDEVSALARNYHTVFMYTSAKTGENVQFTFKSLGTKIFETKYL